MEVANKFKNIETSITTKIFNKIKDMEEQGKEIISFTAGDPHGDISPLMKYSIEKALKKETNHYTSTLGILSLRKVIAEKINSTDNANISKDNIVVCNGAKQAINNIINAILNPGDEVIIFNPTWRAYSEITKLAGGAPNIITLEAENNYQIDFNVLKDSISPITKAIIINNPNNPTGQIFNKETLLELIACAVENDILLISDEVYREIVFSKNNFTSLNSLINEMNKDHIVVINSISKSNAMAGWRVGYMNVPTKFIETISIIQAYTTTNVNVLAQEIAVDAILHDDDFIQKQRESFEEKSNLIFSYLKEMKGIVLDIIPQGSFYIWANIKNINLDSISFCEEILENIQVSLVPGIDFGIDGYIRISSSNSIENIHKGMQRLKEYLNNK